MIKYGYEKQSYSLKEKFPNPGSTTKELSHNSLNLSIGS